MKGIKFSVRVSLVTLSAVVILLSGGFISLISFYGSRMSIHILVEGLMENICVQTIDKTLSYLKTAHISGEITEFMFNEGLLDMEKKEVLSRYFKSIVEANPQIVAVFYGNEKDGKFLMQKQMRDDSISEKYIYPSGSKIQTDWKHSNPKFAKDLKSFLEDPPGAFEPRTRPWYSDAKNKKDHIWTDIYIFDLDKLPGLTYSTPIYSDKELKGVIGIDISIKGLSYFLGRQKIGKTGKAFLINKRFEIIAHPLLENEEFHGIDENGHDEEDHEIINSIHVFRDRMKGLSWDEVKKSPAFYVHTHEGETHMNMYYPFPAGPHDWMIGIVVPEDEYIYIIKKNNKIIWGSSFVLIIAAVFVGIIFARRISRPLSQLSREMDEVKTFRITEGEKINSSLLEVDNMARSFEGMKQGLKSFQKYVPADLVRELISIGKEAVPGGDRRELTVYFSDIANFTSISESLSPEELVSLLSEYLESSSHKITDFKGTIDKYIGDSIMAFWGAPIPLETHALNACLAALNVKKGLKILEAQWKAQSKPPIFKDRIGINTGEVIVGNIGSNSRINYTVIGDTVNLASRIEGLNKYYGTEILISEATYEKVKNDLFTRKVDLVSVKGKTKGTSIYELISEKKDADADSVKWVSAYEEGLSFYLEKKWQKAVSSFEKARSMNPSDINSESFIKRCSLYIQTPPPEDWDGVFRMTSK
ncbi:MAG TPA: adenylate/guanylate cyclase domain-containing protein [Leptospiraceae bacterium]|nr:adenylate/guanylate cyclase domain-containing protein [Leptospiraceae bacterium]